MIVNRDKVRGLRAQGLSYARIARQIVASLEDELTALRVQMQAAKAAVDAAEQAVVDAGQPQSAAHPTRAAHSQALRDYDSLLIQYNYVYGPYVKAKAQLTAALEVGAATVQARIAPPPANDPVAAIASLMARGI